MEIVTLKVFSLVPKQSWSLPEYSHLLTICWSGFINSKFYCFSIIGRKFLSIPFLTWPLSDTGKKVSSARSWSWHCRTAKSDAFLNVSTELTLHILQCNIDQAIRGKIHELYYAPGDVLLEQKNSQQKELVETVTHAVQVHCARRDG